LLPGSRGQTLTGLLGLDALSQPTVAKHTGRGSSKVSALQAQRLEQIAEQLDLVTGALSLVDPLLPLPQPTWLVVRNVHRQALEWRRLAPGLDLRAILNYEREQRTAAG
jgi:hypothetical protein